ncbi:hypothetical protein AeMF1_014087, partial [Aphanomyces euteiches]
MAHGASVNAKSKALDAALHLASWGGHWNIVQELMTHGLSIHTPNKVIPLHHAASNGHVKVVQQLTAYGAQVDAADQYGTTRLHHAASQKRVEVVKELLVHEAFVNTVSKEGVSPLHLASQTDNVDMVKENDPCAKTTKRVLPNSSKRYTSYIVIVLSYSNTTTGIVTTTDEWTRRVMAVKSTLKELCLHEYLWKSNTDAPKTDESHLFCLVIVTESAVDPAQTSRALSKDNG